MFKGLRLVLIACLAFIVTACGARYGTVLTLADDTLGSRLITLTYPRGDDSGEESINGGWEAVDQSIQSHLPSELNYSGLQISDAEVVAKFELKFSSLDDYTAKVTSLLNLGEVDIVPEILLNAGGDGLVRGVEAVENFSSIDLLNWMVNGLVADGVVSDTDASGIFDAPDDFVLVVGGEEIVTDSYDRLYHRDITDYTFGSPFVSVTMKGESVDYTVDMSTYTDDEQAQGILDEFMASRIPEGATSQWSNDYGSLTLQVSATDVPIERVASDLGALLGDSEAKLAIDQEVSETGALQINYTVGGTLLCGDVCSDHMDGMVVLSLQAPEGWTGEESDGFDVYAGPGGATAMGQIEGPFAVTFSKPVTPTSVTSKVSVSDTDVSVETAYVMASADVDVFGSALETALDPGDMGGLDVAPGDDETTYTVTSEVPLGEVESLAPIHGPVSVRVDETDSGLFTRTFDVEITREVAMGETSLQGQSVTSIIDLGGLGSIGTQESPGFENHGSTFTLDQPAYRGGETISATTSEWKTSGIIIFALLIALPILLIALLIIFRKKIFGRNKPQVDGYSQGQMNQNQYAYPGYPQHPGMNHQGDTQAGANGHPGHGNHYDQRGYGQAGAYGHHIQGSEYNQQGDVNPGTYDQQNAFGPAQQPTQSWEQHNLSHGDDRGHAPGDETNELYDNHGMNDVNQPGTGQTDQSEARPDSSGEPDETNEEKS